MPRGHTVLFGTDHLHGRWSLLRVGRRLNIQTCIKQHTNLKSSSPHIPRGMQARRVRTYTYICVHPQKVSGIVLTTRWNRRVRRVKSLPAVTPPIRIKPKPQWSPRRIHRTLGVVASVIGSHVTTMITWGTVSNFQIIPAAQRDCVKVHSDAIAAGHCDAPLTTVATCVVAGEVWAWKATGEVPTHWRRAFWWEIIEIFNHCGWPRKWGGKLRVRVQIRILDFNTTQQFLAFWLVDEPW